MLTKASTQFQMAPKTLSQDKRPWSHANSGALRHAVIQPTILTTRGTSRASLYESMRNMDLFTHLPDSELLKLAAVARERHIEKGSPILCGDDEGHRLLVVVCGEVEALREDESGEEARVGTLQTGESLGEIALFSDSDEIFFMRALTTVRLFSLHRDDLANTLRSCPEFAFDLLKDMAQKLRQFHRRHASLCNQRTPRRVAVALLDLVDERGVRLKDDQGRPCLLMRHRPSQRHIAEVAGTTRESVSRLMARWERLGWISQQNGDLWVIEEKQLRELGG